MLYWANKANMPNSANTFVFTAIGRNRAKAFVITADEFNKPIEVDVVRKEKKPRPHKKA